jgi:hypothetical protein
LFKIQIAVVWHYIKEKGKAERDFCSLNADPENENVVLNMQAKKKCGRIVNAFSFIRIISFTLLL